MHLLYAKQNPKTPIINGIQTNFDPRAVFSSGSEKERYKKITSELLSLKLKMEEWPDKTEALAVAVLWRGLFCSL